MTTKVEEIAEQVKAIPDDERDEFLSSRPAALPASDGGR